MELHQIRYFLALCEELNFTRAAERCEVAQSSLTRAIRALEIDLGGTLFHRGRANTRLSSLGERVKPSLEQIYHHVREAERQARDFTLARTATLRLGLMRSLAPPQLAALIAAMRERHSDALLQVVEGPAPDLQERLVSADLDAAIYALPGLDADDRLNCLLLDSEPFVVVVGKDHPLARRASAHIGDLQSEPYLARVDCDYGPLIQEAFAHAGVEMQPSFRSERDEWILAMVAAGLGYTVMPAHNAVHPGTVAVSLTDLEVRRKIALVTLRDRAESPAVSALRREARRIPLHIVRTCDVGIGGEADQFLDVAVR